MTLRTVPLPLALALAIIAPGPALAEAPERNPSPGFARPDAERGQAAPVDGRIQLAQKQNDDGDGKPDPDAAKKGNRQRPNQDGQPRERQHQRQQDGNPGRDGGQKPRHDAGRPQQNQQNDQAKQNALKQQQLQAEQAKQKALQQQNANKAREEAQKQNAIKQQQAEQAKQKALQQQKDAAKARQNQAEQAKQNAIKQQQLQAEQAKQKALQQQKDAAKAREEAAKNRPAGGNIPPSLGGNRGNNAGPPSGANIPPSLGGNRGNAQQRQQDAIRAREEEAARAREAEKARAEKAREQAIRQKQLDEAARKNAQKPTQGGGPKFDPNRSAGAKPVPGRPQKEFDRGAADREFQRARDQAREFNKGGDRDRRGRDVEAWRPDAAKKFDDVRSGRKERTLYDGKRRDIIEPDNRVIVRQNDRSFIRHDESNRFKRTGREIRRERRKDGLTAIVTMGLAGALIYSLQDDEGRLYRRSRKDRDGREVVLIDNRHYYGHHHGSRFDYDRNSYRDAYVELPPPRVRIPRDEYIVEYDRASPDRIYDTLMAPPVDDLDRGYSLDEVRHSYSVLERMRRVDLDAVNFGFGSWEVGEDQYPKLESMAKAMRRVLDRSPDEVFLIEGHTDAVGSDIDNLSLSDRRAETVAVILSDVFDVPPENLTTQGYGEQYLKVPTEEPSRINRRVSVRRITPLLSKEGWNDRD